MDERTRIQAVVYPWILFSLLARRCQFGAGLTESVSPATFAIELECESDGTCVRWLRDSGTVSILKLDQHFARPSSRIGFRFVHSHNAVRFFEGGRLPVSTMMQKHRLLSWLALLRGMLALRRSMDTRNWERIEESHLVSKSLLLLQSAVLGINGLAQVDAFTRKIVQDLPTGVIGVRLGSDSSAIASIACGESGLEWIDPMHHEAPNRVDFQFANVRTFWMTSAGLADNLAAVGRGDVRIRGYIPLADGFNHLLDRLQVYVKNR